MNTWNNYWIRTAAILVIFMDLVVTATAAVTAYRDPGHSVSPIVYLTWSSYFLVLLTLMISHKKENMQKAVLNCMVLVLAGLPVAALSIPVSTLFRGFNPTAVKGNLYIMVSLSVLFYFLVRMERFSLLDAMTKLAVYTGEIVTLKARSSFARYLVFESSLFLLVLVLAHFYFN